MMNYPWHTSSKQHHNPCNNTARNHDTQSMTYIKQQITIHDTHQARRHNPCNNAPNNAHCMTQTKRQLTIHATTNNVIEQLHGTHQATNQIHEVQHLNKNHCIRKHMHTKQATSVHQWKLFVFNCCSSLSQLILTVFVTAITVLTGLISSIKAVTEQLYNCVK